MTTALTTLTVKEFADRWADDYPRPDARTNDTRRSMIRVFAASFQDQALDQITKAEARGFASANPSHLRYARSLYEDAISDGLVSENPFAGIRLRNSSQGRKRLVVPSEEDIWHLASKADDPMYSLVILAAYSGLRLGELLGLERSDFLPHRRVQVLRQITSDGRTKLPKMEHTRIAFIATDPGECLPPGHGERLFPLSRSQFYRRWARIREEAEMPKLTPHDLRHFNATYLADQGGAAEDIAEHLGHDDGGELCRRLYIHRDPEKALDRLAKVTG